MPDNPKVNQPDYKNAAYGQMEPDWCLVSDVAAGTRKIRDKGREYLPQEPAEQPENYTIRLRRSCFFNAFLKTLNALVGLVFKKNPEVQEDVPDEIQTHLENIDLAGNHIDVFSKELFTDAVRDGHAFVLVDMQPKLNEGATLADEREAGRRPYWVKYKACQALNWRTTVINGATVLSQITFEEKTCEPDGAFGEKEVTRYRVLALTDSGVQIQMYKRVKPGDEVDAIVLDGEPITVQGSGGKPFNRIPVSVVYGRQTGILTSQPPLIDLANLNIAHYQGYSDYRNILHIANVPILVAKGLNEQQQKQFTVSANSLSFVPTDGDLVYCEHQGKAIGAARTELIDLEQRMAMLGLSMLAAQRDSYITATKEKQDYQGEVSELATMARSLQDCLEACLDFHAQYLGVDLPKNDGGSIQIGVADDLTLDAQTLTVYLNAVNSGKLSLEKWFEILAQAVPQVDFEGEAERANTGMAGGAALNAAMNSPTRVRQLFPGQSPSGVQ